MTASRVIAITVGCILGFALIGGLISNALSSDNKNTTDPTRLDEHAKSACGAVISKHDTVVTSSARAELAQDVMDDAARSITNGLADAGRRLGAAADTGPLAWKVAVDRFAQTCLDAGWPRKSA